MVLQIWCVVLVFVSQVGPCTWRPTDFPFEIRKLKSGIELFPDYHLEIGKQKSENAAFSVFLR